jgi:hypothetical protein
MADRQDGRFWLIHFEDADRDVEVFTDEDAARRRSDYVGQSWTHTLFVEAAAPDPPGRMADRPGEAQGQDLGGHGGAVSGGTAADAWRWVEQRTANDCMTACLASIFGVPYEHAPLLWDDAANAPVERWHGVLDDWLAERGFGQLERVRQTDDETDDPMRCPWRFPGYWIAGVKSPRYDGTHAVVMHLNALVWDPHPRREMGHLGFVDATYFLPLDPSRLALGDDRLVRSAALRAFNGGEVSRGTTGDAERRLPESASGSRGGGRSDG